MRLIVVGEQKAISFHSRTGTLQRFLAPFVALTTFSDQAVEAMEPVKKDPLGARASRPHKTPRERGRLARTKPGTREENPVKAGLVRFAREWPWTGGCLQE